MKHATIKDIANHLSLSVSTVSRALTGDKNVREETRENILKTAKELGYSPNPVATNLKYGHTNTIGVIVPEMNTMYTIQVIRGIQSVLYENGIKESEQYKYIFTCVNGEGTKIFLVNGWHFCERLFYVVSTTSWSCGDIVKDADIYIETNY